MWKSQGVWILSKGTVRPLPISPILVRYSLLLKLLTCFSSSIYTQYPIMTSQYPIMTSQYPIMTKPKQVFRNSCKSKNKFNCLFMLSFQTLCYEIIIEMFLQLDWSPPVVNSIEWTWFGQAHTCLCKVPQLTVHVRVKTKSWGGRICL